VREAPESWLFAGSWGSDLCPPPRTTIHLISGRSFTLKRGGYLDSNGFRSKRGTGPYVQRISNITPAETKIFPAFFFLVNHSRNNPMRKISRQRERGKKNGPTIFLKRSISHPDRFFCPLPGLEVSITIELYMMTGVVCQRIESGRQE
jgi:hypothetical protein